jgi:CheY-like chemotaxis protein
VRAVVRRTLERRGLPVLAARHGADALMIWRRHADAIRAVVTDLRMPELGGRELIAQLRAERPTLPVVYLSGYAEDPPDAQDGARTAFVAKPFTMEGLLAALDGVLGAAQD